MIIDCHGHYTTAPAETEAWRKLQVQALGNPSQAPSKASLRISDDQIRESLEGAQLKLQRMRGTDLTFFSPRASAMAHHIGDARTSLVWSEICNELVHRCCTLYPTLEGTAAYRQMVVSAVREDGRAGGSGDGAREYVVQSGISYHRRALSERGHDRLHAIPHLGLVQRLPDTEVRHPARGGARYPTTGVAIAALLRT